MTGRDVEGFDAAGQPGARSSVPQEQSAASEHPPAWLTDDEQGAWRSLLRGINVLTSCLDADLQPHGVSLSEYEILAVVSESPDRLIRMSALAEQVVQSRSRLTHAANRLEKRGWVERRRTADDGRGVLLTLTDNGMEALRCLAPVHLASVRARLTNLLSAGEFAELGRLMEAVRTGAATESALAERES